MILLYSLIYIFVLTNHLLTLQPMEQLDYQDMIQVYKQKECHYE